MPRLKFPPLRLKTQWRRLPIAQRGTIAITIPLLCLVTSLSAHLLLRQRAIQIEQAVDHSQMVLRESHTLLVEMLNAETGVRGYYMRRQPQFLQPYGQALTALPQSFDRLKHLVKGNPVQMERAKALEHLANQQLEVLKSDIQQIERRTPNAPPTNPLNLQLVPGKTVMDQFRTLLGKLESEEQQLLSIRQQQLQQQRDLNILVLLLGVVISGVGAAVAVGLFRDLAQELRQRELRLQESHNLIRAVFANMVDGVLVLNAQEQIEGLNQAAEKMFGYSLQEVTGRNWRLLLTQETDPGEEAVQSDHPWLAMGQRKDGIWFPIEASVSPIQLDDRYIVLIRDSTERQQAADQLQMRADELTALNAELKATNEALSERNRELDQFAYVVAHDLKAPLRAIANLSTWIEEDLVEPLPLESQKHMQLLRGRVHRMEALLNGLLDYARIGRTEIPIETVNVAELLVGVIQTLAPPVTFRIGIDSLMPTLRTRRLLLQQVFTNLIENAIAHHPTEMGTVKISVEDQGDRYKFAIADDGLGINPRFHDKLYTIFQTLQARDIRESRGIGLAMVKKIVEMEGGSIHLESAVGRGSTFRFTWLKQPLDQSNHPVTFMPMD